MAQINLKSVSANQLPFPDKDMPESKISGTPKKTKPEFNVG
jgi:hypothetical protein